MKNKIIYALVVVLFSVGFFFVGYLYHGYQYKTEIEAGKNWEATQYLNSIIYPDITDRVQVVCNFGNKETFEAKNTDLKFTQKDFNTDGKFIGHDKNFLIQNICGISYNEAMDILHEEMYGKGDSFSLFTVMLQ
ncbi:MAG: hypothetical protein EXS48_01810 [Candidatus Staskawiczbacteria bacterium]|nr:hypothetical protein [Candidatus Staskawiczbacteria bacterium]